MRASTTSEVLEAEFLALHGGSNWGPIDDNPQWTAEERDRQINIEKLARYHTKVHDLPATGQTALCLSGGGIRSAAFALGLIQELARRDLLPKFHYLSTVSGGGYIGCWLSAWLHRSQWTEVKRGLALRQAGQLQEAEPLRRLRFNQNFLTPKVGATSPDTWAGVAIIFRDLLLNWLVFVPLIFAMLVAPYLFAAFLRITAQSAASLRMKAQPMDPSLVWLFWQWPKPPIKESLAHWVSWLDGAGALLILSGFIVSAANRPSSGPSTIDSGQFRRFVLLPVSVGTALLVAAESAWIGDAVSSIMFLQWVGLTAAVYAIARLLGSFRRAARRDFAETVFEIVAWAFAGTATGALIFCGVWLYYQAAPFETYHHYLLATVGVPWMMISFLVGEIVYVGLTSRSSFGDRDREWLGRAGGYFLSTSLVLLAFSGIVFYGPDLWEHKSVIFSIIGASGLLSLGGGLSPLSLAANAAKSGERFPITRIVDISSLVFLASALIFLAHATRQVVDWPVLVLGNWALGWQSQFDWQLAGLIILFIMLTAFSHLAALFVNVNWFSLHALYRNRLIKTFLGASNLGSEDRNRFDGFSDSDNIPLARLRITGPGGTGVPPNPYGPAPNRIALFPVINMTLNVLASRDLAWQERKAEPFVATPLHTGGDRVGYRASKDYAAEVTLGTTPGITLGTAMAISGAAASPNWGYHSSPLTSFLMMLFNVRLGLWLGNPKDDDAWRLKGPRSSIRLFIQEAFGQTSDDLPFIYLSDGGHFDNLGLYEMIRRRCRTIIVSDAGADLEGHLEDLGNAVRKISIDMGVRIEFKKIRFSKRTRRGEAPEPPGLYCAMGNIYYPESNTTGTVIYIKPGLYGEVPADVRAYAAANAKFPHETTLNQWFTESQFESYRSLGAYIIQAIYDEPAQPEPAQSQPAQPKPAQSQSRVLEDFVEKVKRYVEHHDTTGE